MLGARYRQERTARSAVAVTQDGSDPHESHEPGQTILARRGAESGRPRRVKKGAGPLDRGRAAAHREGCGPDARVSTRVAEVAPLTPRMAFPARLPLSICC